MLAIIDLLFLCDEQHRQQIHNFLIILTIMLKQNNHLSSFLKYIAVQAFIYNTNHIQCVLLVTSTIELALNSQCLSVYRNFLTPKMKDSGNISSYY